MYAVNVALVLVPTTFVSPWICSIFFTALASAFSLSLCLAAYLEAGGGLPFSIQVNYYLILTVS